MDLLFRILRLEKYAFESRDCRYRIFGGVNRYRDDYRTFSESRDRCQLSFIQMGPYGLTLENLDGGISQLSCTHKMMNFDIHIGYIWK